jgi:heme exporter protein B
MISLPNLTKVCVLSYKRELRAAARNRSEVFNPLIFFVSVVIFVPLGISPESEVLGPIAPGMVWIIALLSVLLSLDNVFQSDFEDGTLEQMAVSGQSLYWLVIVKSLAHWSLTGLPLTLLSPLLAMMLSLPPNGYLALFASLFFGTGVLCFIGAIGGALTVSVRRGGLLISLLIIPFYIPALIFGASCVHTASSGDPYYAELLMLVGMWMLALILSPLASAGALKISLSQ